MPYHIKVSSNGTKGTVVKSATGQPMSKMPIPIGRAHAQMRALYANEPKGKKRG